jgi:hypothetical protein
MKEGVKMGNSFDERIEILSVGKLTTQALNVGSQAIISNQGTSYFVDSGSGSATGDGRSWKTALSTLDLAIGKCTANQGDTIYIAEGHVETVASASAITVDVAGINIIGLGTGADRPTFSFSNTASTIVISASSVYIKNIITKATIDSVVSPIVISGASCTLDIEHQDTSATVEAVRAILTTATAVKLNIKLKYIGFSAGNATVNAIRLVGCKDSIIEVDCYGVFSTAVVECHTTACVNITMYGSYYNHGTVNYSKTFVDTVTGSTWAVKVFDRASGKIATGSQTNAIAVIA